MEIASHSLYSLRVVPTIIFTTGLILEYVYAWRVVQAIDLVDEAAAKLKMEISTKPEALDEVDRKVTTPLRSLDADMNSIAQN